MAEINLYNESKLSAEYLRSILDYDPLTGNFIRRIGAGRSNKGDIAGSKTPHGYIVIRINGVNYRAHRLVFLYIYGKFPSSDIDHINKIRHDNRLINLRESSKRENSCNMKNNNTTIGAYYQPYLNSTNPWISRIHINGVSKYLGCFPDEVSAGNAYQLALKKLNI